MFETKKDFDETEMRTLIELLYDSIAIKERALSSKIFLQASSPKIHSALLHTKNISVHNQIKTVKVVFMPIHKQKEESDRKADGLTNFREQLCGSRLTRTTWTHLKDIDRHTNVERTNAHVHAHND